MSGERQLRWVHGLLCLLEKPLLPDQASDLNVLLNKLLVLRQSAGEEKLVAMLNINISIITEHFE